MNSKQQSVRLVVDGPLSGAWNMSVDQALLDTANKTQQPVLRIYRWTPATLSLGYFQSAHDRQQHQESLECPLVRRASGGGAIVHDREITYSLCIPSSNRWAAQNDQVYLLIHRCIIAGFANWSISLQAFGAADPPATTDPKSFLCFQRRTSGDLTLNAHKVVGSAQRRNKTAILQHGSILMDTSPNAPQLPGINKLANRTVDEDQLVECLVDNIADTLNLTPVSDQLTPSERELAEQIFASKFSNDAWNIERRRN